MRQRCDNPKAAHYADYGGRGIAVCERWLKFDNFLADMGPRPEGMTLERKENNGNYEPGNCRWASRSEQMRNRRNSRFVTYQGKTQTLKDWANEYGLTGSTLWLRWKRGWDFKRALTEKTGRYRR
jgi:hypothetical protein